MLKIRKEKFDIISFSAGKKNYYHASIPNEDWMKKRYVKHTDIDIPLGHSRYGGAVIDLPKNIAHPENMRFAAQLDLASFAPYDSNNLLPEKGQLYFFVNADLDKGNVFYADVASEDLERIIVENGNYFWLGTLIKKIKGKTESFKSRFRDLDEMEIEECDECLEEDWRNCDCEKDEEFTKGGQIWDEFAGSKKSKLFGIFTHCQWEQDEIEEITLSDKIVLLQIGENKFNDSGVFSVVIKKKDLKNRNFKSCKFYWSQT